MTVIDSDPPRPLHRTYTPSTSAKRLDIIDECPDPVACHGPSCHYHTSATLLSAPLHNRHLLRLFHDIISPPLLSLLPPRPPRRRHHYNLCHVTLSSQRRRGGALVRPRRRKRARDDTWTGNRPLRRRRRRRRRSAKCGAEDTDST